MENPVVISNTTPLIALAWLEHLNLLSSMFGQVHVPRAVLEEIQHKPEAIGASAFTKASWFVHTPVSNNNLVALLSDQLDAGESEAIVLAQELSASLLLMDERRGRRRAIQSGLTVTGTLGILIAAKKQGLIESVRPLLDQLRLLPFHMSDKLYADVLHKAGEAL